MLFLQQCAGLAWAAAVAGGASYRPPSPRCVSLTKTSHVDDGGYAGLQCPPLFVSRARRRYRGSLLTGICGAYTQDNQVRGAPQLPVRYRNGPLILHRLNSPHRSGRAAGTDQLLYPARRNARGVAADACSQANVWLLWRIRARLQRPSADRRLRIR